MLRNGVCVLGDLGEEPFNSLACRCIAVFGEGISGIQGRLFFAFAFQHTRHVFALPAVQFDQRVRGFRWPDHRSAQRGGLGRAPQVCGAGRERHKQRKTEGTRRGHWRSSRNPVNVSRDFVKAVCPIQKQGASSPPTISVPALPSSAMKNQFTVCHICHKGVGIPRPVMRRSLKYPPVPPRLS